MKINNNTPILVGCGQVTQKEENVEMALKAKLNH